MVEKLCIHLGRISIIYNDIEKIIQCLSNLEFKYLSNVAPVNNYKSKFDELISMILL